ncbi:MAG: hypothetical protein MI725_16275, partial [Pirellulales bacterium]|nr:hypothetical protein [Pirellulales bacterium]
EYVTDLTAQFRDALESKFIGVEVVPFGVVALLVGVYILLIGPGDYFLVHKVFRRAELTWLTFPLIVVAISVVAYWLANWMKGDQMRVNQVEIVDVDTLSGQVRGTAWTHFFTPEVHQYNLTFQPKSLASTDSPETQTLTSWLGMPGYRLGGMQTRGVQTSVFDSGYAYNADLSSMRKVPVQLWSTKTITARWSSTSDMTLESDLEHRAEELVGSFANTSEVGFEDCHLLYGGQAYALGKVAPGARAVIDGSNLPRRVKTMLTNATAGEVTETKVAEDGTVPFARANMDVARLAKIIMFYRAIDGFRYTNMAHRYQAFLDLSHLLAQDDLAILLCRISTTGSRWFDNDEPLGSNQDRHWTYYRFVLPVESQESRVEN